MSAATFEVLSVSYSNHISYSFSDDSGMTAIITNNINGVLLNSWWVFNILTDGVEGMMLDNIRNDMDGPFQTFQLALGSLSIDHLPFGDIVDSVNIRL